MCTAGGYAKDACRILLVNCKIFLNTARSKLKDLSWLRPLALQHPTEFDLIFLEMICFIQRQNLTLLTNMSTSSMVTALVEVDPTLGDEIDIGNSICVLITTQCDDMLLCPNSFTEDDVVELCIGIGQEHQMDLIKLSDTKVVLWFYCKFDMMATMCCLNAGKGIYCCEGWLLVWCLGIYPG